MSSRVITVPAPVGGLNARDSLADMKPTDAVILTNWFCRPDKVINRKGFTSWSTGITGDIQSMFCYTPTSGFQEMYAVADSGGSCSIYDISSTGAVGAATVSSLTSAQYRTHHMTNAGGTYLYAVNGSDDPLLYDGTTFTAINGTSTPAITGVTTANLIDLVVHQNRFWFVEKNTMSCWYLGTEAISGAATEFNFGALFKRGGHISTIATWTIDAGAGMDDHFVVITTNGEVAIYSGTDPSSSTTWSLVGVYYIAQPIGPNSHIKYEGDVLVLTKEGVLPLSKALLSDRVNPKIAITDKIRSEVTQDVASYGENYGWSITLFNPQNMLIMNVPTSSTTSEQYAMNTINGSWSRFTGINARSFVNANGSIYFGTNGGTVYKFWDGASDDGLEITTYCLPAFNNFGKDSQTKFVKMARVIIGYDSNISINTVVNVDFDTTSPAGIPTYTGLTYAAWDTAIWDSSLWGGDIVVTRDWYGVSGIGYWAAINFTTVANSASIEMYSVDYVVEEGSIL